MVRLKDNFVNFLSIIAYLFQFHNGTIKRVLCVDAVHFDEQFQFHNGTIKSHKRHSNDEFPKNFNSIMVRLKDEGVILAEFFNKANFNSIMVRLKGLINNISILSLQQFQFHNGTIKRTSRFRLFPEMHNFNSIMVRLKGRIRDLYCTKH